MIYQQSDLKSKGSARSAARYLLQKHSTAIIVPLNVVKWLGNTKRIKG